MSPILGIIASQNYPRGYNQSDYESIATVTLSSSQSSISFTSIPSTYKHLQVRGILRGDRANTGEIVGVQYNGDTTSANYVSHRLTGDGTIMGAGPQDRELILLLG